MMQKQISVTIDIPEWADCVAQDYDSDIVFYEGSIEKKSLYWNAAQSKTRMQSAGILFQNNCPNWQTSKIDLRENDFEIVNGELVAVPKSLRIEDLPEMFKEQA